MSIHWEEPWGGYWQSRAQSGFCHLSTYVALAQSSAFLSFSFLCFMIGSLIPGLPTSEALGTLKEIEHSDSYESTPVS